MPADLPIRGPVQAWTGRESRGKETQPDNADEIVLRSKCLKLTMSPIFKTRQFMRTKVA